MIHFETDKKPLTFLLDMIENRHLALPDFQRSFVWDPDATRELVVSVIRSFPAGTILQMEGGGKVFAPRAFEEAPTLNGNPTHLILDGQQRLTSLYQAFAGKGTHRYFLNLQELVDGYDVDEAVEVYTTKRAARWEPEEAQARALMLPLWKLRSFSDWRFDVLEVLEERGEEVKKLARLLNDLEKEYVKPVELYQFPVTTLSASTPAEAVCTIFETLNRTGVKLSVFELLTARAFAHEVHLRDMWKAAYDEWAILSDFKLDPYYVLQTIAMIARKSPKRSMVLALSVDEIVTNWDAAVRGIAQGLALLRDECGVLVSKWLPYETMLVGLGTVWQHVESTPGPAVGAKREKVMRWFWCSVFGQRYDNASNSVTEKDVPELVAWLEGGSEPEAVARFRFDSTRWSEITRRQRALYRGTIALLMRHSPLDFHEALPLGKPIIEGRDVDDHHIFPRHFLKTIGRESATDSVLNHTLIDKKTNIRIGGRAPSVYLAEMENELGEKLQKILVSHGLPAAADGPLFEDDFDEFLDWRLVHLKRELATVTGAGISGDEIISLTWDTWVTEEEDEPIDEEVTGSDASASLDLINRYAPAQARPLYRALVEEVATWPHVSVAPGGAKSDDRRRINIWRRGSAVGSFCFFIPKRGRMTFRLEPEDLSDEHYAYARDVQARNPHKVRLDLQNEQALEEALGLARKGYEEAGRAVARAADDGSAVWQPSPGFQALFEQLRSGIVALGDDVEEVLRINYVAYMAGNRFAAIRNRKDHLLLNLGLVNPYEDPAGLVEVDGTPTGKLGDLWIHWVRVRPESDIEEVVGLARQAYEARRLG